MFTYPNRRDPDAHRSFEKLGSDKVVIRRLRYRVCEEDSHELIQAMAFAARVVHQLTRFLQNGFIFSTPIWEGK